MPKKTKTTTVNSLDGRAGTSGNFSPTGNQCHDAVKDASSIEVGNFNTGSLARSATMITQLTPAYSGQLRNVNSLRLAIQWVLSYTASLDHTESDTDFNLGLVNDAD